MTILNMKPENIYLQYFDELNVYQIKLTNLSMTMTTQQCKQLTEPVNDCM